MGCGMFRERIGVLKFLVWEDGGGNQTQCSFAHAAHGNWCTQSPEQCLCSLGVSVGSRTKLRKGTV